MDEEDQLRRPLLAPSMDDMSTTKVFPLIHRIRRDVIVRSISSVLARI